MNTGNRRLDPFALWITSRFFSSIAKQMQALVVSWQVFELAKGIFTAGRVPLALGYIGLAEAIPFIAMALWAGHSADRYDKRMQIVGSLLGSSACTALLLWHSVLPQASIYPIYLMLAFTGMLTTFEFTSSSSYVQMIVPVEQYPRAIALNLSSFQVATISGPLLGGFLVSRFGPTVSYGVVLACLLIAAALSSRLKKLAIPAVVEDMSGWARIKEGIAFITAQPIILGCMALDMMGVFFGDVIAILPVFAEGYGAGALGLGFLRASPAVGSLAMSLLQARKSFIRATWKNFLRTVAAFGIAILVFAFSHSFWLSALCLVASGMADSVSVIIRQSIYQAFSPDRLRGRVASVSSIFIRASNELGAFESGVAATLLGPRPSVVFGGAMTLVSVVAAKFLFPSLKKDTRAH